ncbi:MAG: T9SS type A sorting domain-containing protein [Bacteroidales bacterium]|nr:T9SS type A sorting domain-containing protein [Bacteroidales bacterium]
MRNKILTAVFVLITGICTAQVDSFLYGGVMRNYITHLPPGYTQGQHLPLVINIHGYTSNASQQQMLSGFDNISDTANFIVVYPNGINNGWNAGINVNATIDDVGFLSALIDTFYKEYGINLNRVYATGMSNGGFMSQRLACELSNRMAAIASVAGTIGTSNSKFTCNLSRIVPVMHIHGTSDAIVNYNGSTFGTSVDSTIEFWVQKDACPLTPIVTQFPDVNTGDGSTITKYYYGLCQDSSEVVLLKVNGAGHCWPGSPFIACNMDTLASIEIWNFFNKHRINQQAKTDDLSLLIPEQPVSIQPNPFSERLVIKMNAPDIVSIEIYNLVGDKMYELSDSKKLIKSSVIEINDAGIKSGIYLLNVKTASGYSNYKVVKL